MKMIEIYNYYGRSEFVRADQIESVVYPGVSINDNGAVVLLGGRRITFGTGDQAKRVVRQLQTEEP